MRASYTTCLLIVLSAHAIAKEAPDAQALMMKNFIAGKVSAFNGDVSMVLINDQGQERVRKMAMWSKLKGGSTDTEVMMRFGDPADIKGTGFLQIENSKADDDIWVYLPALGKTRRLVASNKRDSFFGTDFSYGDVLPPPVEKYTHRYLRNEAIDGVDCYVLESTPIDAETRAESGYSRKVEWLDASNYLERKVEYYDLSAVLLKTQHAYDLQQVEPTKQRWISMRREMVNQQTGHKTIYKFERFALDQKLDESFFSTRNLER